MTADKKTPKRGVLVGSIAALEPRGAFHWAMTLKFTGHDQTIISHAQAGQFVQVACREVGAAKLTMPLLRRPFSISGLSSDGSCLGAVHDHTEKGIYLQFIFRLLGEGTQWLSRRKNGEPIEILGPLGHGFKLPKDPSIPVVLIGGGVGLPPMFFLADTLHAMSCQRVVAIAGARDATLLAGQLVESPKNRDALSPAPYFAEFNRSGVKAIIATDDGSACFKGNVVEALKNLMERDDRFGQPMIYTCGPEPMLRAVAKLAIENDLPCQVCMESYMACGMGVCQSCAVPIHSKQKAGSHETHYKLVCSHGPVFDAREVAWSTC